MVEEGTFRGTHAGVARTGRSVCLDYVRVARIRRGNRPPAERRSLTHDAGLSAVSFAATALLAIVSSVVMVRLYAIRIVGEVALAAVPWASSPISTVREEPAPVRRIVGSPAG